MILVSACLAGCQCRYDGRNNLIPVVKELVQKGEALAFCPEVLGGLSTPRDPCEIQEMDGKQYVISKTGKDETQCFLEGAKKTLALARLYNPSVIILKSKSPSCGLGKIYDGTFTNTLIKGNGLTAELLYKNGYQIKLSEIFL